MPRPLGATPAPGLDAFLTPDSRPQPPDFRLQTSDPSLLTSDSRLQTPDLRLQTPEESRLQKNPGSRLPQTPLTPDFTVTSDSRLQTPDPRPQETPDSTDSRLQAPDFRLQTPDSRLPPPRRSSSGATWPSRCGGGATAMTPHSRCLAVALAAALLLRRRRLTAASPAPHRRAAAASPTSRLGAAPAALCRLAVAPLLRRRRLAAAALPLRCRCAAAALPPRCRCGATTSPLSCSSGAAVPPSPAAIQWRCSLAAALPLQYPAVTSPPRCSYLPITRHSPLATHYPLLTRYSLLTTHCTLALAPALALVPLPLSHSPRPRSRHATDPVALPACGMGGGVTQTPGVAHLLPRLRRLGSAVCVSPCTAYTLAGDSISRDCISPASHQATPGSMQPSRPSPLSPHLLNRTG